MSSGYDDVADDAWLDDLEEADEGGGAGGARGGWADGWIAGANATRCSCPVEHPRSCGSYQPRSWGERLWQRIRGGGRR